MGTSIVTYGSVVVLLGEHVASFQHRHAAIERDLLVARAREGHLQINQQYISQSLKIDVGIRGWMDRIACLDDDSVLARHRKSSCKR